MKLALRIKQAGTILKNYTYPLPYSSFLKQFFKENPNLGSRDRKEIRELTYSYFRLGKNLQDISHDDKLKIAYLTYCDIEDCEKNADILPEEAVKLISSLHKPEERIKALAALWPELALKNIFPCPDKVSEVFLNEEYYSSLLHQPLVWIKIKKDNNFKVEAELKKFGIEPTIKEDLTWGFQTESKLTDTQSYKGGIFRIQDHSSQQTTEFFKAGSGQIWWDCCCGAGGKSLALTEASPDIQLYASDVRKSILENFTDRHKLAKTRNYKTFIADLAHPVDEKLPKMDGIIADVPCTGSGTWARNPENLHYFNKTEILLYQKRQLDILENCYPYLKKGKPLIYITCSIFKEENEEVIHRFAEMHKVEIEIEKYISGYLQGAENMFICRLIKQE